MHASTRMLLIVFSVIGILLILIFYNMFHFKYDYSEAIYRTIFCVIEDTIWANGFSEEKFSKLGIGMNEHQVYLLLGNPLRKTCGPTECEWVYSWQKTGNSSFDRRDVIFNLEGNIIRIRHEFYID